MTTAANLDVRALTDRPLHGSARRGFGARFADEAEPDAAGPVHPLRIMRSSLDLARPAPRRGGPFLVRFRNLINS